MKLFLGFDFYGAGNVGDDLMLAGFLDILLQHPSVRISCIIPHNIRCLSRRFPEVEWLSSSQSNRAEIISRHDCWVGVGDTPFQIMSGPWFLNRILMDIDTIGARSTPMYMLGVGAESEALKAKDVVSQIARAMKHVWTRDKFTYHLLTDRFLLNTGKVTIGSDLANIFLEEIFSEVSPISNRQYELAVTYYAERHNKTDINQLRKFIKHIGSHKSTIFVGNETRESGSFEYGIYRTLFGGVRKLIKKKSVDYYMPDYENSNLDELVKHFQDYKVVMASRYHSLLAAAWAGCRSVALARSSKIEALANELNIPLLKSPFSLESFYDGYEKAEYVSRECLKQMAASARNSVLGFCSRIELA